MTDGVRVLHNDYVDRLHSNRGIAGKLYKGQALTAATASIPSGYQTIVIDNSEKKGFNSCSKRFSGDWLSDDKPGPGTYSSVSNCESHSTSFSKRGTGMMASKDRRFAKPVLSAGPGPSAYSVSLDSQSHHDFSRSNVSSTFHMPIAVQRPKTTGPAPNQYSILTTQTERANNVFANAAFKSKTKRELLLAGDLNKPSPCHYDVKETAVQSSVRVPMSSFKSKSLRQFPPAPSTVVPGPGQYKPYEPLEPVKRIIYPRHSYLCLSVPAMPLPAGPVPPGPSSYDINSNFDNPYGNDAKTAAFASTTKRWTADVSTDSYPSPAHYNPVKMGKQSFNFNSSSRWL